MYIHIPDNSIYVQCIDAAYISIVNVDFSLIFSFDIGLGIGERAGGNRIGYSISMQFLMEISADISIPAV